MTTLMNMESEPQLEAVPAMVTSDQLSLSWFLQNKEITVSEIQSAASALDLPETPLAQGDILLDGLCNMAQHYLRELENSIRVQQNLLLEQPSALLGAETSIHYLPIMDVSGDYYDFVPLCKEQVGVVIGDVCGKGMRAALLMASVCATLRAQVQVGPAAVGELLTHLNRVTYHNTLAHQFVTLIYGIWDVSTHTFTYSSAGHPPVLHYQAATGRVCELNVGSVILGVCEEVEYPTESVSLGMGDVLVLYTDGIIEASDASDQVFGIRRLSEVVAVHGEKSSEALAAAILHAASQFAHQGWEDDVTLMVVKRVDLQ